MSEKCDSIKLSIAIMMLYVMRADQVITEKERKHIYKIYGNEFDLTTEETDELFNSIHTNIPDLSAAVDEIHETLNSDPQEKAKVMNHVNNLICVDGIVDIEYRVFEHVRDKMFQG